MPGRDVRVLTMRRRPWLQVRFRAGEELEALEGEPHQVEPAGVYLGPQDGHVLKEMGTNVNR